MTHFDAYGQGARPRTFGCPPLPDAGGPDELFSGRENVIEGIFDRLYEINTAVTSKAG